MKINTKFFGETDIDESEIIEFKNGGILGFEEYERFVLLYISGTIHFRCLQSVDNGNIAFIIINPWHFFPDYDIDLPDAQLKEIKAKEPKDLLIFNIVSLKDHIKNSTANLAAPVAIHLKERLGKQIVIDKTDYTTRHPLPEPVKLEKKEGDDSHVSAQ
jgi:flagellar assembly factor FliW